MLLLCAAQTKWATKKHTQLTAQNEFSMHFPLGILEKCLKRIKRPKELVTTKFLINSCKFVALKIN